MGRALRSSAFPEAPKKRPVRLWHFQLSPGATLGTPKAIIRGTLNTSGAATSRGARRRGAIMGSCPSAKKWEEPCNKIGRRKFLQLSGAGAAAKAGGLAGILAAARAGLRASGRQRALVALGGFRSRLGCASEGGNHGGI